MAKGLEGSLQKMLNYSARWLHAL